MELKGKKNSSAVHQGHKGSCFEVTRNSRISLNMYLSDLSMNSILPHPFLGTASLLGFRHSGTQHGVKVPGSELNPGEDGVHSL